MNRQLAGIAIGIFFATSLLSLFYLFTDDHSVNKKSVPSREEAQKILQEEGYHILTKEEWASHQTDLQTLTKLRTEKQQANRVENDTGSVRLEITPGMASDEIISLLKEKHVIDDIEKFSVYMDNRDLTKKIQTGTHTVYKNMDYTALAAVLTKGK